MPQRGCSREKRCAVGRRQRKPGLEAGDRLVLRAVVLEHAPQVRHAREQEQVAEEDRGPHQALDHPEQHRGAQLLLDQARQPHRNHEEQHDREHERHDHGAGPHAPRDLLALPSSGSCVIRRRQLRVRRRPQRAEADHQRPAQRHDSADDRQTQHAVALQRRGQRETSSPRSRPPLPAAASAARSLGCSAGGLRTATAQLQTPRIITPSSTACPPTRRVALGVQLRSPNRRLPSSDSARATVSARPSSSAHRRPGATTSSYWADRVCAECRRPLATLRWKRSTRPPVSMSFCLPV